MEHDQAELSRERAASSEPSTRTYPFDDNTSSRKRQRVSRSVSRSSSEDTTTRPSLAGESPPQQDEIMDSEADTAPPVTPARAGRGQSPQEPNSDRVTTLNLRLHPTESIPSSPPETSSKMAYVGDDARKSVESESDALSTIPAIETPSSSASAPGSPEIEVVPIQDYESDAHSPAVQLIGDDEDDDDMYATNLMESFPWRRDNISLEQTVRQIERALQYDAIAENTWFTLLGEWIAHYINTTDKDADDPDYSFAGYYNRYQEFWSLFPRIIWAFNNRSKFFAPFLDREQDSSQPLSELFVSFARLTARFAVMDAKTLSAAHKMDQEPNLASRPFLEAYSYLIREQRLSHIGYNLRQHYRWDWDEEVAMMTENFCLEGGTVQTLTQLAQGLLRLPFRTTKTIDSLVEPCRLASMMVFDASKQLEKAQSDGTITASRNLIMQGYSLFKIVSAGIDSIIEKPVTNLTSETASNLLEPLEKLFLYSLEHDNDSTRRLLEEASMRCPQITSKDIRSIPSTEWKLTYLSKLIMSTQMQLRVLGVTEMCKALLGLFNHVKEDDESPEPSKSPVLHRFASLIIQTGIIEHLVSTASHPEIISESNNILGFLMATKRYNSSHAATIWQTITTSQDPRIVEATLRMIKKSFHLQDYTSLLLISDKAKALPLGAFTMTMRDFLEGLFKQLEDKAKRENIERINEQPYDLCIRLIRESSISTPECPAGDPVLQNFAVLCFRDLLAYGPQQRKREQIYRECIADMAAQSSTAPGSLCVINILVRQNKLLDLHQLTTEHSLTRLVIRELESFVLKDQKAASPAIAALRELVDSIIVNEPSTISTELGIQLWDLMVGRDSKNVAERDIWWHLLNSAVKTASPDNVFIAACFKDHLPTLPPACFTVGALQLAKEAIRTWLGDLVPRSVAEDQTFDSIALEQLWRMILMAPPNTIDASAINTLVATYLQSEVLLSLPRAKARGIHLSLVNRCLGQLAGAAVKLRAFGKNGTSSETDNGMAIVASETEFQEQETIFARSLAVLREFLHHYQSTPHFSTPIPPISQPANVSDSVEGEPFTIKYQSFTSTSQTEILSLSIGTLNTAASMFASLQKATGFQNYKVFCGGIELDPDEIDVCKSLDELNIKGLVLVQQREGGDGSLRQPNNKTTLELEIMKHLDELWGYLEMHEKVAKEIYSFLIKFPIYDQLLKDLDSDSKSHTETFPRGKPFKSMYALHALQKYIAIESQKGVVDDSVLRKAMSLIVGAISDPAVLDESSEELKISLAFRLIECFLLLVKEHVLPESAALLLNATLLERLLQLLYEAKAIAHLNSAQVLTCRAFEAIIVASGQSQGFWASLHVQLANSTLLGDLILLDSREELRKTVVKLILTKSTFSQGAFEVPPMKFAIAFWPLVSKLVKDSLLCPLQCDELFWLCQNLFKKLAETKPNLLMLDDLMYEWGSLLLSCPNKTNFVDPNNPNSIDFLTHGLAGLCYCAASYANPTQEPISCSSIGVELFRKHLFPKILGESQGETLVPKLPLLCSTTRQILAETIFLLVKNDITQYQEILAMMSDLVPYTNTSESGPYLYDLTGSFDRYRSIRSPAGYVGLRNLSNTCYLNSLFTQLYMNIPFREFLLGARTSNLTEQKLLRETQDIFAKMQNTFHRFVDPTDLAASIRTYEEVVIDVTVQMDVDEFYNLLFDRWEGQIIQPDAKRAFKTFYGGQLVQQVRSKECGHISERLEPFSAIQCDIKGKGNLQESLKAYVEGEVMEGENKYKCSTCDRHVDAVKRACLKDIPDNLIFHLKRFDYDLVRGVRSKVNDFFAFPPTIDMRPYKVEYLMNGPDASPEDVFELVGVLVHAGTAESGHYYSFIRERPSTKVQQTWVEFNDDNVNSWDPNMMEPCCYGGTEFRSDGMHFEKSYSAYMLFYQRSSVLAAQRAGLQLQEISTPIRVPIKTRLATEIAQENELLMQKYCLYDTSHAAFVAKMLSNVKHFNKGRCSENHDLEKSALVVALNHLDQVVSRTKDLPNFPAFMIALRQMFLSCAECSRDFLEWFTRRPDALRNLLLRNPDSLVRSEMASSIVSALIKVKADAFYAYGLPDELESPGAGYVDDGIQPMLLQNVIKAIDKLWDVFHTNARAWPEYFGLLSSIAKLGDQEAAMLLDAGFLKRTLEIVSADMGISEDPYRRMLNIVSKRANAARPVSYEAVISLLLRLLQACDLSVDPIGNHVERLHVALSADKIPLAVDERKLLVSHWIQSGAHILTEKLLQIHQNHNATRSILIILLEMPANLDEEIYQAITLGIRKGTTTIPCGPFLRAAITYCEFSRSAQGLLRMVAHVAATSNQIDMLEGKEFLQFFRDVISLSANPNGMSRDDIISCCLEHVSLWAPALLNYYELDVREGAETILCEHLLRTVRLETQKGVNPNAAMVHHLGLACLEFLNEVYVFPRHQAVRANLENILEVIETCSTCFEPASMLDDPLTARFLQQKQLILPALKRITVEEVDEEVSDWDGSEGEYGSSEPMDSVAELCTANDEL